MRHNLQEAIATQAIVAGAAVYVTDGHAWLAGIETPVGRAVEDIRKGEHVLFDATSGTLSKKVGK